VVDDFLGDAIEGKDLIRSSGGRNATERPPNDAAQFALNVHVGFLDAPIAARRGWFP
jgi:hypothetical protein